MIDREISINIQKLLALPQSMNFVFTALLSATKTITNLKMMQFRFEGGYRIAVYYVTSYIVVLVNFTVHSYAVH